jgi:isoquinoline 1-oxidoreductase alpha subunit
MINHLAHLSRASKAILRVKWKASDTIFCACFESRFLGADGADKRGLKISAEICVYQRPTLKSIMKLTINNTEYETGELQNRLLVYVLRDQLGLTGTRFGCGAGLCGSCTVWIDGVPTRSCLTPAEGVVGKSITTIEGLAETYPAAELHPVQTAFIELQVPQCGWCMSGQVMTAAALINGNSAPTEEEILSAMERNYCRCGTYHRIKLAVQRASELAQADAVNGGRA